MSFQNSHPKKRRRKLVTMLKEMKQKKTFHVFCQFLIYLTENLHLLIEGSWMTWREEKQKAVVTAPQVMMKSKSFALMVLLNIRFPHQDLLIKLQLCPLLLSFAKDAGGEAVHQGFTPFQGLQLILIGCSRHVLILTNVSFFINQQIQTWCISRYK